MKHVIELHRLSSGARTLLQLAAEGGVLAQRLRLFTHAAKDEADLRAQQALVRGLRVRRLVLRSEREAEVLWETISSALDWATESDDFPNLPEACLLWDELWNLLLVVEGKQFFCIKEEVA